MKNVNQTLPLILFLLSQTSLSAFSYTDAIEPEICMYVFYEQDCNECRYIIDDFLPKVIEAYRESINIEYFELSRPENYEALVRLEESKNDEDNEIPIIIVGEYILGYDEIEGRLEEILKDYAKEGIPFQSKNLLKDAYYTEEPEWKGERKGYGMEEPELPLVYLAYFYEPFCQECDRAETRLNYLQWKYPNLVVEKFNIADTEVKRLAEALGEIYDLAEKNRMATPSIFIGEEYLIAGQINDKTLNEAIEKYVDKGTSPPWELVENDLQEAERNIINRFEGLGVTTVFLAGLVDGVNPCAFVTIIFFISYLALVGRTGRTLLLTGSAFTAGVFSTYLLIGLGLLKFIQSLSLLPTVAKVVYLLTALGVIVLGVLSIYDFIKYLKGSYKESILKLPRFLQKRIHREVHRRLESGNYVLGAFVTGFLVSILEFACTGQVYLPTIIFVTNIQPLRARAIIYLVIYNLFFILPLLIIFLLAYRGMSSERLALFWRRQGGYTKLFLALIFFSLGGFLIFSML